MAWKDASRWWWFGGRQNSKQSPWLEATLDELDDKTQAMLKLIDGDADSFAQRVEMYYEKRPQLIAMVEDFYRAYRSLAERHDLIKSDPGTRLVTTLGSPFVSTKCQSENFHVVDPHSDSYSESLDSENYAMSEVADPEHEHQMHGDGEVEDLEICTEETENSEVKKLREEIEALKEENRTQRNEIILASKMIEIMEDELFGLREKASAFENVNRHLETKEVELARLREEIEGLRKENEIQIDQIVQAEKNKGLADELAKLREEVAGLRKENRVQRDQIVQMDSERKIELARLREEIEGLRKENEIQIDQIVQAEKNKGLADELAKLIEEVVGLRKENRVQRDQIVQMDKNKRETNGCFDKMEDEICKLKRENRIQRERLRAAVGLLKDPSDKVEQNKEEKDINEYFTILQVEIKKMKTENLMLNKELTQKDEAKREVIRQLSSAMGVLKDENVLLRNFIARESPTKKRNIDPFEICKLTGEISRKLFKGSPTSQASIAAQ
ncbi:hypothetical protein ACFE04_016794 [Oxalis oulophora]